MAFSMITKPQWVETFIKMDPHVKDTLANGSTIAALGGLIMDSQAILTIILVLTGIILNVTRIYDWWKKRDNNA